jgi:hypothetical protein
MELPPAAAEAAPGNRSCGVIAGVPILVTIEILRSHGHATAWNSLR